jgi:glycine/D-amino acid oxidase-like deaminating enzyme/nitrite reductase/ring-hydroxylating ferredoxin subunit
MNADTHSLWDIDKSGREASSLTAQAECDVCVIGAGIAGLTTAYLLTLEGKRVIVLDAKPAIASGETEHTTAHLAWYLDDTFSHLQFTRGAEVAKIAADSHRAAIDLIGEIARTENIDCDYQKVDGYLFEGANGQEELEKEAKTMTGLGLPFERTRLTFPGGQSVACLKFPNHARFHPIKYLTQLAAAFRKRGGKIYTHTVASSVEGGKPCKTTTTHGKSILSQSAVIATNNPFESGTTMYTKATPYTTYAFAAEFKRGSFGDGLYWDTDEPYHYVRFQPGGPVENFDYIVVGGEDHHTGQANDQLQRWDRLKQWASERFPGMGAVKYHWSGEVYETPDGLAFIGIAPGNRQSVYVITGDSGMGMTHSTLGARLVTDLIMGRPNDWASAYSPSRNMPLAIRSRLSEDANIFAQYRDWFTGGDVKSVDDIPPGTGAVIRSGLSKHAVFKDDKGAVTRLSAVCPHMGCIVQWNPGETTWDCPCHGSRFSATGMCLHGPSTSDLKPIDSK